MKPVRISKENLTFVGTVELKDRVFITDPCYDIDTWCRDDLGCTPGTYHAYVHQVDTGSWGIRNKYLFIFKDDKIIQPQSMRLATYVGVDSGRIGFFNKEIEYDEEQYATLIHDKFFPGEGSSEWKSFITTSEGVVAESGYGDGYYRVKTNTARTAFAIVFINS